MKSSDVKLSSLTNRQQFMAGFLHEQIVLNKAGDYIYNEDVVFIARSIGIYCIEKNATLELKKMNFVIFSLQASQMKNMDIIQINEKYQLFLMSQGKYEPYFFNSVFNFEVFEEKEHMDYYGFTLDGDHKYLLSDFLVTHNTCTAITVAEQYMHLHTKPVLVLLPKNLKDGFKKQIFDIDSPKNCTGLKYLQQIPKYDKKEKVVLEKIINKSISNNYEFRGFLEFANRIERLEERIKRRFPHDILRQNKEIHDNLKRLYSDRVIIIDEVHNTRAENISEDPFKKSPKKILQVLQNAENVNLLMLSATPMFNDPREILSIFNFILANEKRPLLQSRDIFDKNGHLTVKGKQVIGRLSQGYVSYMRGQNPFSFPFLLYPDINNDPNIMKPSMVPQKFINGSAIPNYLQMKKLVNKLIINRLSKYQQDVYDYFKPDVLATDTSFLENDDESFFSDFLQSKTKNSSSANDSFFLNATMSSSEKTNMMTDNKNHMIKFKSIMQISILAYPSKNMNKTFGRDGFYNCFSIENKNKKSSAVQFSYKSEYLNFLSYSNIGSYSSKLKSIIDYIMNSEGIVFIYSQFLYSALFPLCIALEHLGFTKSDGTTLLTGKKDEIDKLKYTIKTNQGEYSPKYSLLTPDKLMNVDISKEIEKIKSRANLNGEHIKVVLGTSIAAEGIDFKNIRQVHIIEPWYHLNKLYQVIGRAVRKCSHIDLPIEKRNVTIYKHAGYHESEAKKSIASIDLELYTKSENKQGKINDIEDLMKKNSIDCALNFHRISFPQSSLNMKLREIVTSQGVRKENFKIGDEDNEKSFVCQYDVSKLDLENINLDSSTFTPEYYKEDIGIYQEYVKNLFSRANISTVFTFARLQSLLNNEHKGLDVDILKFALDDMINQRHEIKNQHGESGFIVYFSDKYMFQPLIAPFANLNKQARKDFMTQYVNKVIIDINKIKDHQLDLKDKNFFDRLEDGDHAKDKNLLEFVERKANILLNEYFGHIFTDQEYGKDYKDLLTNDELIIKDLLNMFFKNINKNNVRFFSLCLSSISFIIERLSEDDLIKFLENVMSHIIVKKGKSKGSTETQSPSAKSSSSKKRSELIPSTEIKLSYKQIIDLAMKETKQDFVDKVERLDLYSSIFDLIGVCLYILIKRKYILFLRIKSNTYKIVFRNPYHMNKSFEFMAAENMDSFREQHLVERSLMKYNSRKNQFNKCKLLEMNEILSIPEVRHSFQNLNLNILMFLKGFMSIDFSLQKQVVFKIIDQKIDGGVKCGTGTMIQSNLIQRVNEIDKIFMNPKKNRKKSEICIIYELALRVDDFERLSNAKVSESRFLGIIDRYYLESNLLKS